MSRDFYAKLAPLERFEQVFEPARYAPAPADWVLYLTDVRGSTEAIQRGAYREVNLVGAAGIVAVNNAAAGVAIPYAFGGDGATVAVPPELDAAAGKALQGVAALAKEAYGLDLRVGRVPVATLYAGGHGVGVAKYLLAGEDALAMFWGDGVAAAERAIKEEGSLLLLAADPEAALDLGGLSCRWEPFAADDGAMLSVLVLAQPGQGPEIYREVFEAIVAQAGGEQPQANPVKIERLKKSGLIPSTIRSQLRLHRHGFWLTRLFQTVRDFLETVLGSLAIMRNLRSPVFDPAVYLPSQVARSDFRKFDGMLRMVVELREPAIAEVERVLAEHHAAGRIWYGTHRSRDALMTCAVFSLSGNRHVHFIDGGDGGYALAARGLKKQMEGG